MIVLTKSQTSLVQVLIAHTNIVGTNINLEPLQHFMPDRSTGRISDDLSDLENLVRSRGIDHVQYILVLRGRDRKGSRTGNDQRVRSDDLVLFVRAI